jgi:hypothetical protein
MSSTEPTPTDPYTDSGSSPPEPPRLVPSVTPEPEESATIIPLHPEETGGGGSKNLPPAFYAARSELKLIQDAAYSRMVSPDAVLHSILARIAGAVPHELKLPAIVAAPAPLCYFTAVAGGSNTGKSSAWAIARELLPLPEYVLDGLPVGSGEGLAEILFDWVEDPEGGKKQIKCQVHHNAVVYIDEGAMVGEIAKRSGSTLMATLRQIWSGQTFGQTNAAQDRRRIVQAGRYTYGLVMAIQSELAGPLLDDTAAGTPQRFAWASSTDPNIPRDDAPEWPGPLDWTPPPGIGYLELQVDPVIRQEIRDSHLARMLGEEDENYEAHGKLVQLKIAGLLAILNGRRDINAEDWGLAQIVFDTSITVRDSVRGTVDAAARAKEEKTSYVLAQRSVKTANAVTDDLIERAGERILDVLEEQGGKAAVRDIQSRLSKRQREVLPEAIDLVLEAERVTESYEPSDRKGEDKHYLELVRDES